MVYVSNYMGSRPWLLMGGSCGVVCELTCWAGVEAVLSRAVRIFVEERRGKAVTMGYTTAGESSYRGSMPLS